MSNPNLAAIPKEISSASLIAAAIIVAAPLAKSDPLTVGGASGGNWRDSDEETAKAVASLAKAIASEYVKP